MVFIFIYPKEIIYSVKQGLLLWYNSVLPSIFPFLIASNILIGIGAISKLGRLLTPVMRPLFNVPGAGAFALLMGSISGYPLGAKITADLREAGRLSKDEAQRLIGISSNPGPLFVIGAVGTSILGDKRAGYFIIATSCLSSVIVGLIFRFYKTEAPQREGNRLYAAKRAEAQPFGKIMAASVTSSIETVLQIGGFILLFGAIITILRLSGALNFFSQIINPIFSLFGLDARLCLPFVGGIIEMTNGVNMIGEINAAYKAKVILAGMLVSFGGLSIFSQAASFISKTDISPSVYFAAKVLQTIIQGVLAVLLYDLGIVCGL